MNNDKERLEEIEKNLDPLGYGMGGHLISVNDINWLVGYAKEQVERVQELEDKLTEQKESQKRYFLDFYKMERSYSEIKNKYIKTCNQNKRYREALEFYANKINYLTFIENGKSNIEHDQGEKARKALEGDLE